MSITLRDLGPDDWPQVHSIYADGIAGGNASFASAPPSWAQFDASKRPDLRFVAVDEAAGDPAPILGWIACSPISDWAVFGGVVEISLYVSERARGRGVGSALLAHLIERSEATGVWSLTARIFPENDGSIRLHERHGFRLVGIHRHMGYMEHGPYRGWRDNALLERRSTRAGIRVPGA
ncbi:MAG: GNAT family N-acetyltransferase [Dermabacter sp.]|nr:GNAT family N-acetyltransferase [Dermabacter sp.]